MIQKGVSYSIQGDSRVVMTPTELKMQPTIHLEPEAGFGCGKCIVGCIFNYLGLIIIRELPCITKTSDDL
jgi:hypothetical protein